MSKKNTWVNWRVDHIDNTNSASNTDLSHNKTSEVECTMEITSNVYLKPFSQLISKIRFQTISFVLCTLSKRLKKTRPIFLCLFIEYFPLIQSGHKE